MTFVCALKDIPDSEARGFELEGESIIVVKSDAQICVYMNRCPHLGIPLNWEPDNFMDSDGDLIRCSTHGALFLINDGQCVSGPCIGQSLQARSFQIIDDAIYLMQD